MEFTGKKFSQIWFKTTISMEMRRAKYRLFCPNLNVLTSAYDGGSILKVVISPPFHRQQQAPVSMRASVTPELLRASGCKYHLCYKISQ